MPLDSDVALLGTGAAPLVAASHLLAEGKSVLLLNPDFDFFLEGSELPLDPLLIDSGIGIERLRNSLPEAVLDVLRPVFPGAVEFCGPSAAGFRDTAAPHVRARGRLWLGTGAQGALEDLYVEASDAGLNPSILDGILAARRFPGTASDREDLKGLWVPNLCDVDVVRYRNGLLEFVRERLGPTRVVCEASQMELMPGGIRFHARGESMTAKLSEGMLVFWTPRMTSWIASQAKKLHSQLRLPSAVRYWEQWSLTSTEPLDPSVVGVSGEMVAWAEAEGDPILAGRPLHRLSVLRESGLNWGSTESFQRLSALFHDLLRWEQISIRAMKPRAVLSWGGAADTPGSLPLGNGSRIRVVTGSDGPLFDVIRRARHACGDLEHAS